MSKIYVVLIKAHTGLGSIARKIKKFEYTHVAVCFDNSFTDFYSFSRKHHFLPADSGFMIEKRDFYAFGEHKNFKTKIFEIEVPEEVLQRKLPVLSLLPLLENITVHNIIDSEHHMTIQVGLTEQQELFVKNPVYPKTFEPETHGTGLKNLQKRFILLMDKELTVKQSENEYCVILPLA